MLYKYSRLAHYHNEVVDKLCRVSMNLQKDNDLVRSINSEVMMEALIDALGLQQYFKIEPKFTAEDLRYVDIMPVLGIAIQWIGTERKDVMSFLDNDPTKPHNFLCDHDLPPVLVSPAIRAQPLFQHTPWEPYRAMSCVA